MDGEEGMHWKLDSADIEVLEDGKEMKLDTDKLTINDVMEEVDRHSRFLKRQADLTGN